MKSIDEERDDERRKEYTRETMAPCSHVVVSSVADFLDCSPLELEPLYRHVDPDALDALVDRAIEESYPPASAPKRRDTIVRFEFAGCDVVATAMTITVSPLDLITG